MLANITPLMVKTLTCKAAIIKARTLNPQGVLQQLEHYCYLSIDDDYIHAIYPLLPVNNNMIKPAYFAPPNPIGAHVSVIYPEENVALNPLMIGQKHSFTVDELISASYGLKEYIALSVSSPSLVAVRQTYGLASKPTFKQHTIVFHITVGMSVNRPLQLG